MSKDLEKLIEESKKFFLSEGEIEKIKSQFNEYPNRLERAKESGQLFVTTPFGVLKFWTERTILKKKLFKENLLKFLDRKEAYNEEVEKYEKEFSEREALLKKEKKQIDSMNKEKEEINETIMKIFNAIGEEIQKIAIKTAEEKAKI